MQSLQCVTKANNCFSSFKVYILSLLLTRTKKNCTSMSRELGIPYYSIYSFLNYQEFNKEAFEQHQIALVYLNDLLRKHPDCLGADALSQFCIEWAAMAAMVHDLQPLYADENNPRPYLRVNMNKDPLSFALTLTDQIQDFARPNARFTRGGDEVKLEYGAACSAVEVDLNICDRELMITYCYVNPEDFAINKSKFKR